MELDGGKDLVILPFGRDQGRSVLWQGPPENKAAALDNLAETELPWWREASVDLFGCASVAIRNGDKIYAFAAVLCDPAQGKRLSHGEGQAGRGRREGGDTCLPCS